MSACEVLTLHTQLSLFHHQATRIVPFCWISKLFKSYLGKNVETLTKKKRVRIISLRLHPNLVYTSTTNLFLETHPDRITHWSNHPIRMKWGFYLNSNVLSGMYVYFGTGCRNIYAMVFVTNNIITRVVIQMFSMKHHSLTYLFFSSINY